MAGWRLVWLEATAWLEALAWYVATAWLEVTAWFEATASTCQPASNLETNSSALDCWETDLLILGLDWGRPYHPGSDSRPDH